MVGRYIVLKPDRVLDCLGPTLPAFVTPPVLEVLSDKFNLMPITTPQEDLQAILGK